MEYKYDWVNKPARVLQLAKTLKKQKPNRRNSIVLTSLITLRELYRHGFLTGQAFLDAERMFKDEE